MVYGSPLGDYTEQQFFSCFTATTNFRALVMLYLNFWFYGIDHFVGTVFFL